MRAPNTTRARLVLPRLSMAHGLMVVAGLITFLLVANVLTQRGATVDVLVATDDLPAGAVVGADSFSIVAVDAAGPLASHLVGGGLLDSSVQLRRALTAGEPILRSDLVVVEEPGVRTLTVPVDDPVVAGLGLRVGDRVDIIGADRAGELGFVAVDLIVSRLPASGSTSPFERASVGSWITIEVTDQEALLLARALDGGDVAVIRSTGAIPLSDVVGIGIES